MSAFSRFLQNLLVRTPREIILAILRIIVYVIVFILALLAWLWECLLELLKGKKFLLEDDDDDDCGRLPEAIIRRPDPCIYSQKLLLAQGLPVTWNNPDIWLVRADAPGVILPDSYHLDEDTDYIVNIRVHNASATDPAIGVRVRLNYRPWSFNSPDLTPVETDVNGNEVVRYVNIFPMGSTVTTFNWHTPPVPQGDSSKHYCIQASLFHPMDINTENNLGQENTNVLAREDTQNSSANLLTVDVPLFNLTETAKQFRFRAIRYQIQDEEVELKLKSTFGSIRRPLSQRIANFSPKLHTHSKGITRFNASGEQVGSFDFQNQSNVKIQKSKYVGFEDLEKRIKGRNYEVPDYIDIRINDQALEREITLAPGDQINLQLKVQNNKPNDPAPLTFIAIEENSQTAVGGVTLIV